MQAEILKKKAIKHIEDILEKHYGVSINLREFEVLKTGVDEKIWLVSKAVSRINLDELKINVMGMYFGKLKRNNKIKLSIEGCQMIGDEVIRNVVDVDDEHAQRFMKGGNLEVTNINDCEQNNFVLIKHNSDFLGIGKLSNTFVENLIPKSRRIAEVA